MGGGTVPSQAFGFPHRLVVSSSQETFPVGVLCAVHCAEISRFGGPCLARCRCCWARSMGSSFGVELPPQLRQEPCPLWFRAG